MGGDGTTNGRTSGASSSSIPEPKYENVGGKPVMASGNDEYIARVSPNDTKLTLNIVGSDNDNAWVSKANEVF